MKRIYLDSNILISFYSADRAEETRTGLLTRRSSFSLNSRICNFVPQFEAITEMVNILVSRKRMPLGEVAEIESQLMSERRLKNLKIQLIEVSPDKEYDFAEFFYHVRQSILISLRCWRQNSQRYYEK
ncbi:MAG: hypothetical protein WAM58_21020 [Candidatus Acidiferrum sp.]